jgi:exonuclease SbcD
MTATIILGDVHLGSSLQLGKYGIGSELNSRLVDQINLLEWTLDRAIEFDAKNIIITGDVFHDPKPHPTIITFFVSWLKKCTDNDVDVHVIAGNHDILRSGQFSMSALDIISASDIEGVFVYKQMSTLHIQDVSFTLMPFRDRRSFNTDSNAIAIKIMQNKMPYELAGIDLHNKKVVVGHFSIEGSIPIGNEIDDMTNELFLPVSMFNGYDFVWMGHVHKMQVMSEKEPYVAHIGSMDISDFGESEHKKVIVVFDPKETEVYKYIEIPTRPLNQISISVPEEIKNTTEYVVKELQKQKSLSKAIVRLDIAFESSDVISVDRPIIEKCLSDLGAFHISRINEERKIAPIKMNSATEGMDNTVNETVAIRMYADANVDENIKDEFSALANSIVKECNELKAG